jgi:cystathionine beta-lyase/cystathionine gamma-synthase
MGYDGWPGAPAACIEPGAVRLSIGLEDGEDIIADAHLALDSLGQEGKA